MNRQIKALGAFLLVCYIALFVKLNQIQVVDADKLNDDPNNARPIQREFNRARGQILSADGAVLAFSQAPTDDNDVVSPRVRVYPEGDLFGQITGFYSYLYLASGVEKTYNEALMGRTFDQQVRGLSDLFTNNENVGNVTLTVNKELQQVARDSLKGRGGAELLGAVVVLDPRSGEVLAMWSNPSYDPTLLSSGSAEDVHAAWQLLTTAPGQPMKSKAFQERYFPGSTFKVVTAGIGLQTGKVTNENPVYPTERSFTPPQTDKPLFNFGGSACGGPLPVILTVSCNTAFARMGSETIRRDDMVAGAQQWGFNTTVPLDIAGSVESVFPAADAVSPAYLAQMSIGQLNVQASPLTMALVAGAAGTDGKIMTPHVMRDIRNSEGQVVTQYKATPWFEPMAMDKAAVLKQDMYGPVYGIPGHGGTVQGIVKVPAPNKAGGKTGTAQTQVDNRVHTWFMGFAGPDGQPAQVAVAVVVLDQNGANNDSTGGAIAGPIANTVMNKALEIINRKP